MSTLSSRSRAESIEERMSASRVACDPFLRTLVVCAAWGPESLTEDTCRCLAQVLPAVFARPGQPEPSRALRRQA